MFLPEKAYQHPLVPIVISAHGYVAVTIQVLGRGPWHHRPSFSSANCRVGRKTEAGGKASRQRMLPPMLNKYKAEISLTGFLWVTLYMTHSHMVCLNFLVASLRSAPSQTSAHHTRLLRGERLLTDLNPEGEKTVRLNLFE